MKYMLLVYGEEARYTPATMAACYQRSVELSHEINARGQFLGASPLQPVSTATSVRVREGKRLVTDGPFAETREQLGGFYLVDAPNLDAAVEIAGRIPGAEVGTVEIRPVVELDGLPEVLEVAERVPVGVSNR